VTVEDIRLIRSVVGRETGIKAAGGIRTLKDALRMLDAGANRIGTSSGPEIVQSVQEGMEEPLADLEDEEEDEEELDEELEEE